MSNRNNDDYFNLDNFDESLDSREYRRRQPNRRNTSYNGRPSYNKRKNMQRRKRVRLRNRIVIVVSGLLILTLLITLIVLMFKGCGSSGSDTRFVPTTTKPAEEEAMNNSVQSNDKLSAANFILAKPTDDTSVEGVDAGTVYVWNNAAYELFGGSDASAEAYSDTINGLAEKLPGINVYSMIVPNHTEMGLPERVKNQVNTNSQAENIKKAYAGMSDKVTAVNAYNYLSEHCNEYIYFKSDHHWTGLGSYYAYKAFADTLGLTPVKLEDCTEQTIDGFTGTFSTMANGIDSDTVHYWKFPYDVSMTVTGADGQNVELDSPYYELAEAGSNTYGVFIEGDNPVTVMKSSAENAQSGKKIAVVKESYGNAFVPYLTANYEEVHVIDFRSFRNVVSQSFATYCNENGITDVLFLNGIMSANTPMQLDSMEGMFN